ncbi:MAG: N-acetyltransferase [Bryobacteraceae bacterium]
MILRKATLRDIPEMLALVNTYAAQGAMLPRTEFELAEDIRDFVLAETGGRVAGCGALHIYTPTAAEVRSLAVHPEVKGTGVGRAIVEEVERQAREIGLASLFAFTYVPGFFAKLGYDQVDRGLLPQKAWKDCLRCPKFQACDEIAVHKQLRPVGAAERAAEKLTVLQSGAAPIPARADS